MSYSPLYSNKINRYLKKITVSIIILIVFLLLKRINLPITNKALSKINYYVFEQSYNIEDFRKLAKKTADLREVIPVFKVSDRPKIIFPVEKGKITSSYNGEEHNGINIAQEVGVPVKAVLDGVVVSVDKDDKLGKFVKINHSKGVTTVYGYLKDVFVKKNDKVFQGSVIGTIGNVDNSEEGCLHFEILKNGVHQDPKKWFQDNGKLKVSFYGF